MVDVQTPSNTDVPPKPTQRIPKTSHHRISTLSLGNQDPFTNAQSFLRTILGPSQTVPVRRVTTLG